MSHIEDTCVIEYFAIFLTYYLVISNDSIQIQLVYTNSSLVYHLVESYTNSIRALENQSCNNILMRTRVT